MKLQVKLYDVPFVILVLSATCTSSYAVTKHRPTSQVSAQPFCQKAAIDPLLNNVKNLIVKDRTLLRGAAENTSDHSTHDAYLRQWGYQAGGDLMASEPKGTRTDLNDAVSGLSAYLNSCAR